MAASAQIYRGQKESASTEEKVPSKRGRVLALQQRGSSRLQFLFSHDLDADSARGPGCPWLLHSNLCPPDPGILKAKLSNRLRQGFHQGVLRRFDKGQDPFPESAVVHGVLQPIAFSGLLQVHGKRQVDHDRLLPAPLLVPGANDAVSRKVTNQYSVHA